MLFLNLVENLY